MAVGDITAKRTNYSDFPCNVFDGVDDYVEIPHNAAQLGANLSNGFTISAWINPRSAGEGTGTENGVILTKGSGVVGANGFVFGMRGTNNNIYATINNGTKAIGANNSITFGIWQHALVTISSGQLANIYINGTLTGTANQNLIQTIAAITTTNVLRIGNDSTDTGRTFNGSIRDVKMWNRVLTAAEIAADYAGSPNSNGLIHHFKLGGDYNDYGSVGVAATNSGSVANTTIPLKLQTNASQLNLAAVTDKIIAIPTMGRYGGFALIGANRAAA